MTNTVIASIEQERVLEVRQQHCDSEFVMKDTKAALATMSDNPHVLMVPLGGETACTSVITTTFSRNCPRTSRLFRFRRSSGKTFSRKKPSTNRRMIKS